MQCQRSSPQAQGVPVLQDAEFGEEVIDFEGICSQSGSDVRDSSPAEQADGRVPHCAEILRRFASPDAAGVLVERDVANPMHAVLDLPVSSPPFQESRGVGSRAGDAGDGILHVRRRFPLASGGPRQLTDLADVPPTQMIVDADRTDQPAALHSPTRLLHSGVFVTLLFILPLGVGGKKPPSRRRPLGFLVTRWAGSP